MINHYAGGGLIGRTAALIAPGAVVMATINAGRLLSGLHISPAVTFGCTGGCPASPAQEASPSRDRLGAGRAKSCRYRA